MISSNVHLIVPRLVWDFIYILRSTYYVKIKGIKYIYIYIYSFKLMKILRLN